MEKRKILTFLNCFFCSKTFNIEDLIEMNTNSLLLGSETVDFSDLVLDVCFVKMKINSDSYTCLQCKDLLVQFHIFKKNVKKYKNFKRNIKACEIFSELDPLLDDVNIEAVSVVKHNFEEILIATESQHDNYKIFLNSQLRARGLNETESQLSNDSTEKQDIECQSTQMLTPDQKHKISQKISCDEQEDEQDIQFKVKSVQDKPNSMLWANISSPQASRWNTNSGLSEVQKTWIHENAKNAEVSEGTQTFWKCAVCAAKMSSSWVLRKHLRDVHVIKPNKVPDDKKRGPEFMEEVRSSKIIDDRADDKKAIWKCKRCFKVLKSESGFIKHLLYSHIKNSSIDPVFVSKCKIQIEYEAPDQTLPLCEIGWACPECKKFYKTSIGLRNHLKLGHAEIDFGGAKYREKKKALIDRSLLLKEEESQSEIILDTDQGPRKIWQCHRCTDARFFKSERGFKAHIRTSHLQNRKLDEVKIAKCKIIIVKNEAKVKAWKCSICATVTKTKEGFISHLNQEHPSEFDDTNEEEEKDDYLDQIIKVEPEESILIKLTEQVSNDQRGAFKVKDYKFSCNECGLYFGKHYSTHLDAHKTFKSLASCFQHPKCEQCRVILANDEAMLIHLQSHEDNSGLIHAYPSRGLACFGGKQFKEPAGSADDAVDENIWKCGHCFAQFWDESECVQHQMMLHVETLICPFDQLPFKGNRGLAQFSSHMKNKHTELFPDLSFPCTYCNADFPTIFDKLTHMKQCVEKKLECDGCGRKFFCKIKLAHHLKIEKGLLSYECSRCGKKCSNSVDLRLHTIGAHTNDRLYVCTFKDCSKAFKKSAARSSHMETHSDVTLSCVHCGSVFKKRVVLARHIKMMHDDAYREECFNEFTCKLCSKPFLRRVNYKSHLKSVHNIIEEDQEV